MKREGNRVDRGGDLFQEAIGGDRRHGKKKGDRGDGGDRREEKGG